MSARQVFLRSLRVREEHKGKAGIDGTALAQSYVSLGNLLAEQPGRADEALSYLRDALRCYREALGWEHPKVAWAHEGIAKALTKQGQLGAAQDHMDQAIHIKQKQAATSEGNQDFKRDLVKLQQEREKMMAQNAKGKSPSRQEGGADEATPTGGAGGSSSGAASSSAAAAPAEAAPAGSSDT